jgi:hypothetical protein
MKDNQGDDFAKVGKFLKNLTVAEHYYLGHVLHLIGSVGSIIEKFSLSKERACELFHVKLSQYDNYTKGNYTYSVRDMAVITAVYRKLETERIAEAELFKVSTKLADKKTVEVPQDNAEVM